MSSLDNFYCAIANLDGVILQIEHLANVCCAIGLMHFSGACIELLNRTWHNVTVATLLAPHGAAKIEGPQTGTSSEFCKNSFVVEITVEQADSIHLLFE